MKNVTDISMDDKIYKAIFKAAAEEALREEMAALPSDEELNEMYPRTKTLDKKVNAVLKQEFKTARRKQRLRLAARVAAVVILFVLVGGSVLMSVEASRNFILNTLIDRRGDYIAFDFGIDGTPNEAGNGIILGYLPEGLS